MFEATGDNVFLVLTYNNAHLPRTFRGRYPCFNQEHIKALMKKLRTKYPKIRYFFASEYGKTTKRPHYHPLLSLPKEYNSVEVVEYIRTVWTGKEYVTGRNTKESWKYGNLGFVFPSKSDVKKGRHLINSTAGCSFYAAKYATKDVDFLQDENISPLYADKYYRRLHRDEFPTSHVCRYYGLGILGLMSSPKSAKYINPLTNRPNLVPQYVKFYALQHRVCDGFVEKPVKQDDGSVILKPIWRYRNVYNDPEMMLEILHEQMHEYALRASAFYDFAFARKMAVFHYIYQNVSSAVFRELALNVKDAFDEKVFDEVARYLYEPCDLVCQSKEDKMCFEINDLWLYLSSAVSSFDDKILAARDERKKKQIELREHIDDVCAMRHPHPSGEDLSQTLMACP